ncbi:MULTISPECIES: tetratricopeptide repeat protein [Chryseobacterium]|uniref:tetratricopeptide repeat protein n=1 Tax=Chryseobacterium TaxID=59732 RepID=UPI00195687BA|nr:MULTISPECIES: tetratricopeptide repeat protein [Chryseobacterium]MBM7420924.1 tetratricopeptide (TPR) repeat protein [Chryseobacterium sp. JUb44]MDH6210881.1 tetratricopeptide (TPR) repeat protein [Chryseobacterium sp. BIGb0186]WSO09551.1 tetratricopeptide repeat protein [Chryseobacterium scophthalmum]
MKRFLLLILFPVFSFSQNKNEAEVKVNEGIILHDEGKYNDALDKYEEALKLDKNNLIAISEKAMTLEALKKYDEAIELCKLAISIYPKEDIKTIYITYGNSLDHSKRTKDALKIYDEGIKKYPNYYQLYFNKAITLVNDKQIEKSLELFQKSATLNPNHLGSLNALAALNRDKRIISILASLRYLSIDNKTSRAKGNLDSVVDLMQKGVTQTDDKNITLAIDPKAMEDMGKKKKGINNFSTVDMVLSMTAALDFDEKNKNKTQCQKAIDKFESIFAVLKEGQKENKGFYWEFLAPYFIELKDKNLIEPFANIVFLPFQEEDVKKYHQDNANEIQRFYEWDKNYPWK